MTQDEIERRFREKAAVIGLTDPDVQAALMMACSAFARIAGDLLIDLTDAPFKERWKRYEGVTMLLGLARDLAEDIGAAQDGSSVCLAVALRGDLLAKCAALRAMYGVIADTAQTVIDAVDPRPSRGFKE